MVKLKKFLKEWRVLLIFALVVIVLRLFVFDPVLVDGHSMDPTLENGQRMILSKRTKIHRFDIVVAIEPDEPDKKIIKRVIGLPGDTVTFKKDQLTVNGKKYSEPYLDEYKQLWKKDKLKKTYSYSSLFQKLAKTAGAFTINSNEDTTFTLKVPLKHYLLLGDNRLVSKDGRDPSVGMISDTDIQGEVKFTFWPLNRIGFVKKVTQ